MQLVNVIVFCDSRLLNFCKYIYIYIFVSCRIIGPPFTSPLRTGIPIRSRRFWIKGHRLTL